MLTFTIEDFHNSDTPFPLVQTYVLICTTVVWIWGCVSLYVDTGTGGKWFVNLLEDRSFSFMAIVLYDYLHHYSVELHHQVDHFL